MKKVLQLTLGVMTALGGFVDIGELVFATDAGARFGYSLLWTIAIGTIGIMVYSEMCGRVAAVKQAPVFEVVRDRLGKRWGLVTLIASNIVNVITCAAEIGGFALVIEYLTGWPFRLDVVLSGVALAVLVAVLPFKWIERFFGLLGLMLLVFGFAVFAMQPDWSTAGHALVPNVPALDKYGYILYAYFVVGIFSAVMMPYEVYFYSSGAIEENWTTKDLSENTLITTIGMALGGLLAMALVVIGAAFFLPKRIYPELLGTIAAGPAAVFGKPGLLFALLGMLFAVGGSAVETGLAAAYNLAQYFGWKWGRKHKPQHTPRFTMAWVGTFVLAILIAAIGIYPVELVEYGVMLAVVVLPLTYYPILVAAKDRSYMGKHANATWQNVLGWLFFGIVSLCGLAAIPLLVLTKMGQP
jgi:Mn2+/Fe2+ NRAMP family transporter